MIGPGSDKNKIFTGSTVARSPERSSPQQGLVLGPRASRAGGAGRQSGPQREAKQVHQPQSPQHYTTYSSARIAANSPLLPLLCL